MAVLLGDSTSTTGTSSGRSPLRRTTFRSWRCCFWFRSSPGWASSRRRKRPVDRGIENDPKLAKTHHRKVEPWRPGWAREIHVWPYLVRIEFLATVIVTVILFVWSITLNAPLEEPANPNLTMNPSKAPWYFLGLQEMLVYFDPWIAGVVMPSIIMVGLMVFPYVDSNPLGNGYYTLRQRRFALWMFGAGFLHVDPADRSSARLSVDRVGSGSGPVKPGTTTRSCSIRTSTCMT